MVATKPNAFTLSIVVAGAAAFILLVAAVFYFRPVVAKPFREDPFEVVTAYLKATYARDYRQAYQYISSPDREVWDEESYASQYGSLHGFALELSQKLAEHMEIWVIDRQLSPDRGRYTIGYRAPTADELSALLFDWDPDQLNALSLSRQKQLLETVAKMSKDEKIITIKGQETFDLIADEGRWKIFYDWASASKIKFNVALPLSSGLDVQFPTHELLAVKDEPFQISLKVQNRSKQPILARIVHHVEPEEMQNHIDMIACGALQPLALEPGEVQEISSAYLINDGIRAGMRIAITYEFKLEPLSSNKGAYSKRKPPPSAKAA
jgi:hypothetical protein